MVVNGLKNHQVHVVFIYLVRCVHTNNFWILFQGLCYSTGLEVQQINHVVLLVVSNTCVRLCVLLHEVLQLTKCICHFSVSFLVFLVERAPAKKNCNVDGPYPNPRYCVFPLPAAHLPNPGERQGGGKRNSVGLDRSCRCEA